VFNAADGPVVIAVGNDDIWRRFAPLAGLAAADERFSTNAARRSNAAELTDLINAAFGQRPIADWLADLHRAGVPAGELKSLDRVYDSAQLQAQNLVWEVDHPRLGRIRLPGNPLQFSRTLIEPGLPPPTLGQHTGEVRADLLGHAQADGR
jgi:formyl-CoA transferase